MFAAAKIIGIKEDADGTCLQVKIPSLKLVDVIFRKRIKTVELRFDDGRHISAEQRRKAYATMRDISDYTGYHPEEQKEWLKYYHISRTGDEYFSLSNCSMDTAREFINSIMDYALYNGIPLMDFGIDRTDDIHTYLYQCLKHRRCAVCGREGEIHHWDTIGMGNDRRKVDDSGHRKICLCRVHHTMAHQRGREAFEQMYKIYGILYNGEQTAGAVAYSNYQPLLLKRTGT